MANKDFNWNSFPTENSAKNTSATTSGGFNWDSIPHESQPPSSSVAQTALEHFGNGAALNYLPQLQAKTEMGIEGLGNLKDKALGSIGLDKLASVDYQLRQQGFKIPDRTYLEARDANIQRLHQQAKDNPLTAGGATVAGGLASAIATSGVLPEAGAAATLAGRIGQGAIQGAKTGAIYGGLANPGDIQGEINPLQLSDRIENSAKGGVTGALIGGALPVAGKVIQSGASRLSERLKALADKSILNSTGATGKQSSTFADDAAEQLRARGLVRAGDDQATIAKRVSAAVDASNAQIDDSLAKLEAQGVKVDGKNVFDSIQSKINQLKSDPSQADIVRMLEKETENLSNALEVKGTSNFGVKEAEQIKRGYNRKAGNWADPEKSQAGKQMYQTYRQAVEDAARAADPETAKIFEEAKKTYGLLSPIQEAAERRAATTSQSPPGGLADLAAAGAGAVKAGPIGAVLAPIARRVLAPRAASTIAVGADKLSGGLQKLSSLGSAELQSPATVGAVASRVLSEPTKSTSLKVADNNQDAPLKGEAKWASDGLDNLLKHSTDPDLKQKLKNIKDSLLSDPKVKRLLVSASDLKPGSKAMDKILTQVESKLDEGAR